MRGSGGHGGLWRVLGSRGGLWGPATGPKGAAGAASLHSAHSGFPAWAFKALKRGLSGDPGSSSFPPQK